jgi:hypothetical protein
MTMSVPFLFLLNVILASRLAFTFKDEPISRKQTAAMLAVQAAGLTVYEIGYALAAVAAGLVTLGLVLHLVENRLEEVRLPRLLSLLIYVAVLSIPFSPSVDLTFNPALSTVCQSAASYSWLLAFLAKADWGKLGVSLFGLLLVVNEANILVRYLFSVFNLEPKTQVEGAEGVITIIDTREYNAGRVIGILERMLVYYLVLKAQYGAIGLVLAAKSFTRFKDLEKRDYAEYVLIGTLASTLLAMLAAAMTQSLWP